MDQLRQSLPGAPIIEKGDYEYFAHPISDGAPMLEPGLLHEIIVKITRRASLENVDKIVTPTAMGIYVSTAVLLITDILLIVARKHRYGLDDEVSLYQQTDYSKGDMSIDDINEGDRMLVLDNVLSTGGTMKAIFDAPDHINVDVVDTIAIIKKTDPNESDDSDHYVRTFINMTVEDGEVVVVDEHGDD